MTSKSAKLLKKVDMHLHTSYSDGKLSPKELLNKVKSAGLECVGIVDHDSVNGIEEAVNIGKNIGVEVIPGVELSTMLNDTDIHILGYFIDYKDKTLLEFLEFFREERIKRAKRIIHKLNSLNIPIDLDIVLEISQNSAIGRPHIAHAMVNGGYVDNYRSAFIKYIRDGGPAYEKKYKFPPEEAIKIINQAGGLSFIAHPGGFLEEKDIYHLINIGVDGIEIIHPNHNKITTEYYKKLTSEYFLLECGGSDFHGGMRDDDHALGKYTIPYSMVTAMKQRLFK